MIEYEKKTYPPAWFTKSERYVVERGQSRGWVPHSGHDNVRDAETTARAESDMYPTRVVDESNGSVVWVSWK